ncbi:MAG: hypothetical protein HONBIEJF_02651 [Fimbriimonadaceae bacterium]|nr:hypothetical protein [Fimbriimonadaceae bacterium]
MNINPRFDARDLRRASPCPALWNDMEGDDVCRTCPICNRKVYRTSGLRQIEVAKLVDCPERRLGRLLRRSDGTVIAKDCPIGGRQAMSRIGKAAAVCAAFVTFALWQQLRPDPVKELYFLDPDPMDAVVVPEIRDARARANPDPAPPVGTNTLRN